MTTTRTCVPEFVIRWLEEYKRNQFEGTSPFVAWTSYGHVKADAFEILFKRVTGFEQFYPRCKMAYDHPDMRMILEM